MAKNDLGISVLKSACNSEVKDLALDWGELGLDALLDEGVLKDAPILGSIVSICTISKTIRDWLFVRKIWDFLRACPKFTESEKEAFVREYLNDANKEQRLSDAVVLILDRLDDLEKPALLAKVFAALVQGNITLETFRRLAAGIDIGFISDLNSLCSSQRPEEDHDLMRSLLRTGLVNMHDMNDETPIAIRTNSPSDQGLFWLTYTITPLGRTFIQCVKERG